MEVLDDGLTEEELQELTDEEIAALLDAIAVDEEDALSVEIATLFAALLQTEWRRVSEEAIAAGLDELASGSGRVSLDEVQEITQTVQPVASGSNLTSRVSDGVTDTVQATYTLGQEAVSAEVANTLNVTDRRVQNWLDSDTTYWIGTHYDRQVQERIQNAQRDIFRSPEDADVLDAIDDGDELRRQLVNTGTLGRREAGQVLQEAFAGEMEKSDSYWRLLANHVTTRSREFGRIEGFVKAGIDQYQIDAVIDRVTSDICRFMDGKTFQVADAVSLRDDIISADEPEDVKDIAPWLSIETIQDDSTDELAEKGFVLPPFHANCRSRAVGLT